MTEMPTFSPVTEIEFELLKDNTAKTTEGEGRWTMIYDEVFEIRYNEKRYLAHPKYFKSEDGNYKTNCSETLIGWYYDPDRN